MIAAMVINLNELQFSSGIRGRRDIVSNSLYWNLWTKTIQGNPGALALVVQNECISYQ